MFEFLPNRRAKSNGLFVQSSTSLLVASPYSGGFSLNLLDPY